MSDPETIHIEADGAGQLFALQMKRMATLTAIGGVGENYYGQLLARQADWLTCLINSRDERLIYELRLTSEPHTESYLRGRLTVALLCRMDEASETEAREYAVELLRLCEAFFDDEYEFALIESSDELARIRQPFAARAAAELLRRAEWSALDTLRGQMRRRAPGFAAAPHDEQPAAPETEESRVLHVYPYLLNSSSPVRLLKLMLMQSEPVCIGLRLRPTRLTEAEAEFLERQIALCERYAQASVGPIGEDLRAVHPTLQEQARLFQRRFTKSLYALKDNAALLRVHLLSPAARVPQTVIDAFGSQLTAPAGGRGASADDLDSYLSGGYEFAHCAGEEAAHAGLAALDFAVCDETGVPDEARRLRYLFDSMEAVAAFRFPAPTLEDVPGVRMKSSRTQLAPASMPESGHLIGFSRHNGRAQAVHLMRSDRRRHLYAVGQTGTGKTTMFEAMILRDARAGEGFCVLDPHGDLIENLLAKLPRERVGDVVLVDPSDVERPVGLNVLEYETEAQKHFLIQEVMAIIERLIERYDPNITGPMFFQHVRMILQLVMSRADEMGTLAQFYQVFNSKDYYKRFLPLKTTDPVLRRFVEEILPRADYTRQSPEGGSMGSYISSKFEDFVSDPMLRNIFGQERSTFDLREIMDARRILLVNLSKGRLGEINSRFFGMLLIAKLQAMAMGRAAQAIEDRRDFYLYVDEFQSLATLNFGTLLSEARKYRLNLILTNQYVAQVDRRITAAIAGNVGTTIAFRVGAEDAEMLERDFLPVFNRYDLMNLPNFNTYVSTLVGGEVSKPFSMQTVMDATPADKQLSASISEHSRLIYGRERATVEAEIDASLRVPSFE